MRQMQKFLGCTYIVALMFPFESSPNFGGIQVGRDAHRAAHQVRARARIRANWLALLAFWVFYYNPPSFANIKFLADILRSRPNNHVAWN